jgi:hypothetical protein
VVDQQGMIRADFEWSEANKAVFDGEGLDAVIDKLLAGSARPAAKAAPKKK